MHAFLFKKKQFYSYTGYIGCIELQCFLIICSGVCQSAADSSIFSYFTVDYVKTDFYRRKLEATVVSKAVEKILVFCVPSARACLMCVFRPCVVYMSSVRARVHVLCVPSVHEYFLCFLSVFCIMCRPCVRVFCRSLIQIKFPVNS